MERKVEKNNGKKKFLNKLPTQMNDEEFEKLLQQIGFADEEIQEIVRKTSINEQKTEKEYFTTLSNRITDRAIKLMEENKSINTQEIQNCQSLLLAEIKRRLVEQRIRNYENSLNGSRQNDKERSE